MSRTSLGIKNSQVALIYYVINMLLGFYSRKVFIDKLGAEVLGLNTTVENILGFLNLAELGIGSAIAFSLYKPLADNDIQTVKEIVSLQGWLYKKIAYVVIVGSLIASLFFPIIFRNVDMPLFWAYASFSVFLYSSLLSYFANYKQILFSANQQEYKITFSYKSVLLIKTICQIATLKLLGCGYIDWLIIQVLFVSLASITLNRSISNNYPFVKYKNQDSKTLYKKYPVIVTKIKQLFFHKIAGFVLTQTSPLIIFAYSSLTMVAIYGNYMLVVNSFYLMFQSIFNSITSGVGNLVAEGQKEKILDVFEELFSSRFFCVSVICYCLFKLVNPFITLWVGPQYLLGMSTITVIIAILYLNLTRSTVDSYISAYGLYNDIYAPLIEAALNISLSILLGRYLGITGILSGVLISLLVVVFFWKPYFLFSRGIRENIGFYVRMYIKHLCCLLIAITLMEVISSFLSIGDIYHWAYFIGYSILVFLVFSILLFIPLYSFTHGMKSFVCRMKSLLYERIVL